MCKSEDNINNSTCPRYSEKYEKMGVTPEELYFRQQGKCWLSLAFDKEDGVITPGELYCTDGKELSPTSWMLNPTFECMKCVSHFILEMAGGQMQKELKLNGFLTEVLKALAAMNEYLIPATKHVFKMSTETCNYLETYCTTNFMSTDVTKPLRLTKSSDLLFFGVEIIIDDSMPKNKILLDPCGYELELPSNEQ